MVNGKKFGLALSGGGYRAAAFHLGTLRKLQEMQLLEQVDVLSTISGGSITGACYCLKDKDYPEFEKQMIEGLATKNVIGFVLRSWAFIRTALLALLLLGCSVAVSFTRWSPLAILPVILLIVLLMAFQFCIFPAGKVIERAYDHFFYRGRTLSALCETPMIAIGSSNLQSGRPFTFSKGRMGDSSYTYEQEPPILFLAGSFPVTRAVTASSCVPFAFSPVRIAREFFAVPTDYGRVDPRLIDGGVYDNQGIHKLGEKGSEYRCDTLVVSDAGNRLPFAGAYNNTFTLLLRTVEIFMQRIKNVQMIRDVYENPGQQEIAYLSLGWRIENCIPGFLKNLKNKTVPPSVISAHGILPQWEADPDTFKIEITIRLEEKTGYAGILAREQQLSPERLAAAQKVSTNLTCLKRTGIEDLITHAANLTELQVRLYCPHLLTTT